MDMTVYIVQDQHHVDKNAQLTSKFDFSSTQQYGEIRFILKPNSSPFNLLPAIRKMHSILCNFTEDDYLLLIGNPILLGLSVAIAADYNGGNVKLLQWSGAKQHYIAVTAEDIFNGEKFLQGDFT
jgi:hypothetical protein